MGLLDDFSTLSDSAKQYALNALARFGNGVGDTVQQIPGNAQKLAQGLLNLPHDVSQTFSSQPGGLFSPQLGQQINQAMSQPQPANPGQWMDKGMALAGMSPVMGLLGHTVYHGSPHKFDAFDMSKIGTGEGAQAYGHGLYMAESPEVAKSYMTAGRGTDPFLVDFAPTANASAYDSLAKKVAHNHVEMAGGDVQGAIKLLEKQVAGIPAESQSMYPQFVDALRGLKSGDIQPSKNLYKVDIPDESIPRMLDWDRPLSEQPPEIQNLAFKNAKAMKKELGVFKSNPINDGIPLNSIYDLSGSDLLRVLGRGEDATNTLKQAGIPGIRYLDGNSRGTGGTSNFVLFDDQLPRILEVNGQPTGLKPWNAK